MRDDYLSLAEAEEFVGGDIEARRKRIQDAGKTGKLPWTLEFDLETGLRAGRFVQPVDWLLEPDWERRRLAQSPHGFETRISRKDLVECFGAGKASKKPARKQFSEAQVERWVRDVYAPSFKGRPPGRDEFEAAAQEKFGRSVSRGFLRVLKAKYLPGRAGRKKSGTE